jgi:hypothetical protein
VQPGKSLTLEPLEISLANQILTAQRARSHFQETISVSNKHFDTLHMLSPTPEIPGHAVKFGLVVLNLFLGSCSQHRTVCSLRSLCADAKNTRTQSQCETYCGFRNGHRVYVRMADGQSVSTLNNYLTFLESTGEAQQTRSTRTARTSAHQIAECRCQNRSIRVFAILVGIWKRPPDSAGVCKPATGPLKCRPQRPTY